MTRFTVAGDGTFPFDMLRYDSCFPASSTDAASIPRKDFGSAGGMREVTLVSHSRHRPTTARWNSFGWGVINIEERA